MNGYSANLYGALLMLEREKLEEGGSYLESVQNPLLHAVPLVDAAEIRKKLPIWGRECGESYSKLVKRAIQSHKAGEQASRRQASAQSAQEIVKKFTGRTREADLLDPETVMVVLLRIKEMGYIRSIMVSLNRKLCSMLKEAGPHVTNAITLIQSCFIGGDLKNSLVPVVNESFILPSTVGNPVLGKKLAVPSPTTLGGGFKYF